MKARNKLLAAPPYQVEQAIKNLGTKLRLARVRRNLSLEVIAAKIGTTRQAVAAAEHGKPSTGIAVYAGLLWAMGLVDQLSDVAAPDKDEEGEILARSREKTRARTTGSRLSNDF
jgi:transcriptional regulator with XRE-family HTH domain